MKTYTYSEARQRLARLLDEAGIPALPSPARAAKAMWSLVKYGQRQRNAETTAESSAFR